MTGMKGASERGSSVFFSDFDGVAEGKCDLSYAVALL